MDLQPCKTMTDTLTPVEHTNWALSAWNSTFDRNDVPLALAWNSTLDRNPLWPWPGILPLIEMMSLRHGCMVRTICG